MEFYSKENEQRLEKGAHASQLSDTKRVMDLLSGYTQVEKGDINIGDSSFSAWRVVHNNSLGPGKGGIRFHPDVAVEEVKSLALWMSVKNSLLGIPYGGAKGGVAVNVGELDLDLKEKISRAYVDYFYPFLGPDRDIPAPDVYTDERVMGWMLDQYEKRVGYHAPASFTGKPFELGGCGIRKDATSKGGFMVLKKALSDLSDRSSKTVAIQGFGNAGSNMAYMLSRGGFNVVGVSDSKGGVYHKQGLDIEKVSRAKADEGSVVNHKEGEAIENQDLLELPVDILVLAAMEYQITEDNTQNIKAKYVVELANGPISDKADNSLFERGVAVLPDVLSNAGGVLASYFEWSQNKNGQILEFSYLEKRFKELMEDTWKRVYNRYSQWDYRYSLRASAYSLALERIIFAEQWRGNV